jgi:uncharacterized protein (TIGR00251 family)
MVADAVSLRVIDGGVRLRLRVKPGSRHDRIIGAYGGALKIEVRAAPERGKANESVVKLLAGAFGVKRSDVIIVSGASKQDKTAEIRCAGFDAIADRLRRADIEVVVS